MYVLHAARPAAHTVLPSTYYLYSIYVALLLSWPPASGTPSPLLRAGQLCLVAACYYQPTGPLHRQSTVVSKTIYLQTTEILFFTHECLNCQHTTVRLSRLLFRQQPAIYTAEHWRLTHPDDSRRSFKPIVYYPSPSRRPQRHLHTHTPSLQSNPVVPNGTVNSSLAPPCL